MTPAALFFTFEGVKIKESRQYCDSMTLLTQMGAKPNKVSRHQARAEGAAAPPTGRSLQIVVRVVAEERLTGGCRGALPAQLALARRPQEDYW